MRRRREFLWAGVVIAALFFGIRASGAAQTWTPQTRNVVGNLISGYFGATWIFALVGYARAWIRQPTPALRYATEAVYPFYIGHQTITVALVYALAAWPAGVWPKFSLVALGTFVGSWMFFEAVRRVTPLRPLFGLKLRPAARSASSVSGAAT
jgi:hypothetical protein